MEVVALIGGTGLYRWSGEARTVSPETPYGAVSAPVAAFERGRHRLLFLARHGADHSIAPHRVNYRANLFALKELGARTVIAANTVGGISDGYTPGVLAVPDQLIDYTWGRAHTFWEGVGDITDHSEFGEPFAAEVRRLLLDAAGEAKVEVRERGCVGVTQGPRFETAAEVRRLGRDGCDMVGMTSMPEAALARELELAYGSLCVVANRAAGLDDGPVSLADIERTLADAMQNVRRVIETLLSGLD